MDAVCRVLRFTNAIMAISLYCVVLCYHWMWLVMFNSQKSNIKFKWGIVRSSLDCALKHLQLCPHSQIAIFEARCEFQPVETVVPEQIIHLFCVCVNDVVKLGVEPWRDCNVVF